jgi:hypothetical protein
MKPAVTQRIFVDRSRTELHPRRMKNVKTETVYVYRNNEARSRNHCCHWKASISTYSECVSVALVIRHAKRMRRIILSSVACPVVPYFTTLSQKTAWLKKKTKTYWKENVCFDFFYNFSLKTSSLSDFDET